MIQTPAFKLAFTACVFLLGYYLGETEYKHEKLQAKSVSQSSSPKLEFQECKPSELARDLATPHQSPCHQAAIDGTDMDAIVKNEEWLQRLFTSGTIPTFDIISNELIFKNISEIRDFFEQASNPSDIHSAGDFLLFYAANTKNTLTRDIALEFIYSPSPEKRSVAYNMLTFGIVKDELVQHVMLDQLYTESSEDALQSVMGYFTDTDNLKSEVRSTVLAKSRELFQHENPHIQFMAYSTYLKNSDTSDAVHIVNQSLASEASDEAKAALLSGLTFYGQKHFDDEELTLAIEAIANDEQAGNTVRLAALEYMQFRDMNLKNDFTF